MWYRTTVPIIGILLKTCCSIYWVEMTAKATIPSKAEIYIPPYRSRISLLF
jgi:hypothetical protein